MCSLTWLLTSDGYHVCFNRDEQKSRVEAVAPSYHQQHEAIYPVDPQGGGTWIAVTKQGATLCLLNNYQANIPSALEKPTSRGQVIIELINSSKPLEQAIVALDLANTAPFTLVYFSPSLTQSCGAALAFSWDGLKLRQTIATSPMVSSGFDFEAVQQSRTRLFSQLPTSNLPILCNYHRSHQPSKGPYSICMHRDDAQTVSFSQISVNTHAVKFLYINGAPCETDSSRYTVSLAK